MKFRNIHHNANIVTFGVRPGSPHFCNNRSSHNNLLDNGVVGKSSPCCLIPFNHEPGIQLISLSFYHAWWDITVYRHCGAVLPASGRVTWCWIKSKIGSHQVKPSGTGTNRRSIYFSQKGWMPPMRDCGYASHPLSRFRVWRTGARKRCGVSDYGYGDLRIWPQFFAGYARDVRWRDLWLWRRKWGLMIMLRGCEECSECYGITKTTMDCPRWKTFVRMQACFLQF